MITVACICSERETSIMSIFVVLLKKIKVDEKAAF
jgi:hypothetical protein